MLIAKGEREIFLEPSMANRHGLISGATGTGKTVSLQVLAQNFSRAGVPVFMADVKGDLAGIAIRGGGNPKVDQKIKDLGLSPFEFEACPTTFWDIFGEKGHPVRTTISEMGPLMLGRMLDLNETQGGNLDIVFKLADDNGLLLLDIKDLKAVLQFAGDNVKAINTRYGRVSTASIGTIQRNLLRLEEQGGGRLFGEPALSLEDLRRQEDGRGVINLLAADRLIQSPKTYSTFLLWLLSELFEKLPEVGDLEKPRLVFFFDEAHLLFADAPKPLLQKIEQVVRLIRSRGVGIFFVTQNPLDVPDAVLGQLGNRIQHALRAFTPRDQKVVRAVAETFRPNPRLNTHDEITRLQVGEALISFLDPDGSPGVVEKAFVLPPAGRMGTIDGGERKRLIQSSFLYGRYENEIDRESAFEILQKRAAEQQAPDPAAKVSAPKAADPPKKGRQPQGFLEAFAKSAVRSFGSSLGRKIFRGTLGSLLPKN
jgi:hypothetical protein